MTSIDMGKVTIPTFKLNNGIDIPALGYGTWLGLDEKKEFQIQDMPKFLGAISYAIDIGYRHIDTAHVYRVEPEVGSVVRRKIAEGIIKREDIFITTKVWNHNHRPEDVEASVRGSLQRMGLDYIDLVLIHWPMSISQDEVDEKIDYLDTWRGFESVLEKGLVRAIGVSNFTVDQLKRLLANCFVVPAVNQVEINLTLGQQELVDYCQQQNILMVAYTPFGSMIQGRAAPNAPEPKYDNPVLTSIAQKHGKTVTQIALRYLYERGIASIPKTLTKSRIVENASIFDFELGKDDIASLRKFDVNYRTVRPSFWQQYQNYPLELIEDPIPEIPVALMKWKNGAKQNID